MPYVLDTDIISALQRGDRAVRSHVAALATEDVFVTIVSLQEQMRGRLQTLNNPGTEAKLIQAYAYLRRTLDFYASANVLPYDDAASRWDSALRQRHRRMGTKDRRIAAIALANGCTLVTRNSTDFRVVGELRLTDWMMHDA